MPGLNQLKQFSEDIREVGDEVKIRAQRGEKVPVIPFPQGISEADDSNDFIIGIPDKNNPASAEEEDLGSIDDILGTNSDSASGADDFSGLDSDIAALLNPQASADEDALADFLNDDNPASVSTDTEPAEEVEPETPLEDLDLDSLLAPSGENGGEDTPAANPEPASAATEPESFSNVGDALSNLGDLADDLGDLGDLADLTELNTSETPADLAEPAPEAPAEPLSTDSSVSDISGTDNSDFIEDAAAPSDDEIPSVDMGDLGDLGDLDNLGDLGTLSDFSTPDSSESAPQESDSSSPEPEPDLASQISEIDLSPDAVSSEVPSAESSESNSSDAAAPSDDLFAMDLDDLTGGSEPQSSGSENESDGGFDFNTDMLDGFGDAGSDENLSAPATESSEPAEIPNAFDEVPDESFGSVDDIGEGSAIESFDTSGMDGVDFGPSEPAGGEEFPATDDGLGGDDDFVLDSSFEIPGFSDTETADLGKKKPILDTIDFSKGKEGRPKNSLTEEEYVQFKKNLSNYPLNLRIALEDFIARDEFTDEAVFEIIEKVLKKVSARQLATQLEKILDISINIPRDFERRSFAEYEAYKQSFQYQLKNRIIPAAIVGIILAFVCFGLFKAGQHFIYEPVMANMHYKQGYTLLEANEFPQSEDEFAKAVKYRAIKKWFFKYAVGYRNKKQFERAAQMYRNILAVFNHDKQAGLDYAEMELVDRANYERAEEIVRREVLDYHINDADGILMLGDVFLEWAEVDPSKYELAKEQYLDLIQRYGSNNVYLSRMMRYNIRTDKLREVLYYKNIFYQSKQDKQNLKNLGAADWTELSGYMLEKLYGTLSKNDEYLRSSIEDVLAMLNLAIKSDPSNPVARYNLARYFIHNGNTEQAKVELERSLDLFEKVIVRTKKNVYREINASRVLGELYAANREYLKAQTIYTRGINLYNEEHEASELEGDVNTGKLFADMGDLDYFISGEMDDALYNYEKAIEIKNDIPSINYRVGAIYYNRKNYDNALVSFIKVAEKEPKDPNILLSLGNVLSLRGDNFAAESYYADLLRVLDQGREKQKLLLPQEDDDDYAVVDLYLKVNNNLGVTLYRLAQQTGDSGRNAEAIVRLSDSIRAYDALTRNQQTMIRMEGSNLAAQNSKYITHPYPDFEPAIYTDIPRLLSGEKGLE